MYDYDTMDDFERAMMHFGTRIQIIVAMEMADKIATEDAYQEIKKLYKDLKKARKTVVE
jgi:CO dehydrogenase/acetyl-CoA synthase beta subunit